MASLSSGIQSILTGITELPSKIVGLVVEGIKKLFIPSDGFMESAIGEIRTKFNSLIGIDVNVLSGMPTGERSLSDLGNGGSYLGYTVSKWVDVTYLESAINTFRSTIRGLIIFLLVLFNLNQTLMLFGASPMSMIGSITGSNKANSTKVGKGDSE